MNVVGIPRAPGVAEMLLPPALTNLSFDNQAAVSVLGIVTYLIVLSFSPCLLVSRHNWVVF